LNLIDTHVHLYEKPFENDLTNVIEEAKNKGVSKMLMPNVDAASVEPMNRIALENPGFCYPMIGLHPCYVAQDFETQLKVVEKELSKNQYVAVGEIGLDLYWDKTFFEQQKIAFTTQTQWAMQRHLPIAIHSREATDEAIALLTPLVSPQLTGVFHCFTGTVAEAQEIVAMGFYLGIGGVVTYKNGGLDQVLPHIPLEKIVLETDAPYLAPVPYRGKRNESSYLPYIASKVAEIYGTSTEKVAEITTSNAEKLFKLPGD
jgi:TatD DNase family protein